MTKPTLGETTEAWAVLERAGIFPLVSVCVADIMEAHRAVISEAEAFEIADKVSRNWEGGEEWVAMMAYVHELVEEKVNV